ncbi:pyruvate kinase [Escherichia coli]
MQDVMRKLLPRLNVRKPFAARMQWMTSSSPLTWNWLHVATGRVIGDPELVGIQKALIRRARQLNRAVITATQMMESMITNPMPTRAEVMDVANAVLDGTDAVTLSAETAAGQYPSETVAAMARVCLGAEKSQHQRF